MWPTCHRFHMWVYLNGLFIFLPMWLEQKQIFGTEEKDTVHYRFIIIILAVYMGKPSTFFWKRGNSWWSDLLLKWPNLLRHRPCCFNKKGPSTGSRVSARRCEQHLGVGRLGNHDSGHPKWWGVATLGSEHPATVIKLAIWGYSNNSNL